jgi:hypothetical protein
LTGDLDELLTRTQSDNANNSSQTAPVSRKGSGVETRSEARPR